MSHATQDPQFAHASTRRDFLAQVGRSTVAAGALSSPLWSAAHEALAAEAKAKPSETLVTELYGTLTDAQKEVVWMPYDHPRRLLIGNNWAIVKPTIKDIYSPKQQAIIREIFKGVCSEEWVEIFDKQMLEDGGPLETYHGAIFGEPGEGQFEWVLSGRHHTSRVDGDSREGVAFGGPIVYGHAVEFHEDADHPGNVFWHQAKRANEVFAALDPDQRKIALLQKAPAEDQIELQGETGNLPGLALGKMSSDQKELVQQVMGDLLAPYRQADRDEVMKCVTAAGGVDKIHLSYYQQEDIGKDQVWDIWRLEGPAFVWHFRGAPHVHVWVNICSEAKHSKVAKA
jgi:hypothetical protein